MSQTDAISFVTEIKVADILPISAYNCRPNSQMNIQMVCTISYALLMVNNEIGDCWTCVE